jgi:hypothetical protein
MPVAENRAASQNAEIPGLVSWFLMGGCGAVHQSKPPGEKIVLDWNLPSSWVSPILPRRIVFTSNSCRNL